MKLKYGAFLGYLLICIFNAPLIAKGQDVDSLAYYLSHSEEMISTDVNKAQLYVNRAKVLAIKSKSTLPLLQSIRFEGLIAYYNGEYPRALSVWLDGLKLSEKDKIRSMEASFLNEIANLYKKQKELQKSLSTFEKALEIAQEINDSIQIANVLNNLGVAYQDNQEYDKALKSFEKSIQYKKSYNDTVSIAYNYANIGTLLGTMGKYNEALEYIKKSTDIRIRINDTRNLAINYTLIAEIYDQKGDRAISRNFYFKSLKKAQEVQFVDLQRYIYEQVSNTYSKDADFKKALEYKEKALVLKDSLFNVTRSKQIAELDKKYQSAKKEQELAKHKEALAKSELIIENRNNTIFLVCTFLFFIVLIAYGLIKRQQYNNNQLAKEMELKQRQSQIEALQKLQFERERIAKDLHDNIGAQLSFIGMQLDGMQNKYHEQIELVDKVQLISSYARQSSAQLRETIWAINNEAVSLYMLTAKLKEYVSKQNVLNTDKSIVVKLFGNSDLAVTPAKSLALFRVCQEAINNAEKHANFKNLLIEFTGDDNTVTATIQDDGIGFELDTVKRKGHGLGNMEQRIYELDGKFVIFSQQKVGTKITIELSV